MLQARNIGEPQIQLLGIVLLGKFQNFFRSHSSSRIKFMGIVTFADAAQNNRLHPVRSSLGDSLAGTRKMPLWRG
jgi:hypothetical protein